MTTIGKIESFDDTKENWETYVERLEQFFLANNRKQGHIERVCRSKQQRKPKQATKTPRVHAVEVDGDAYKDILATF